MRYTVMSDKDGVRVEDEAGNQLSGMGVQVYDDGLVFIEHDDGRPDTEYRGLLDKPTAWVNT